jgi:hypothetical protein
MQRDMRNISRGRSQQLCINYKYDDHKFSAAQMPLGLQLHCIRAQGCIMLVAACWRQLLEKKGREGAVIVAVAAVVAAAVAAANFW